MEPLRSRHSSNVERVFKSPNSDLHPSFSNVKSLYNELIHTLKGSYPAVAHIQLWLTYRHNVAGVQMITTGEAEMYHFQNSAM